MQSKRLRALNVISFLVLITCSYLSKANDDVATNTELQKASGLVNFALKMKEKHSEITENSVTRLAYHVDIEIGQQYAIHTYKEVWHYPNQASIQDYGYETIYYDEASEVLTGLQAVTIQADGTQYWFNNDDAQTLDSDTYNSFTDGKELIVNYVGLSKDSISAIEYKVKTKLSRLEAPWSDIFYVRSIRDQGELKFHVKSLNGKQIFHHINSDVMSCDKQKTSITCFANRVPSVPDDENMLFRDQTDHLVFSEVNDWQAIKDSIANGFYEARQNPAAIKAFVQKLVTSEMTLAEKISKVHEFVAREVRYVSVSEAGNAYTPHSINRTFEKRYGDCKDKTALLLEMLFQIGVDAHPVLVSTTRRDASKLVLPSAGYFNHVILCFDFYGENKCIDATDSTSDWRYTSNWILGDVSLPLLNDAQPQNIALSEFPWRIISSISLEFLENGSQQETQEVQFFDSYASRYRSQLETESSDERLKWVTRLYQRAVAEDKEPDVQVSGIETLASSIDIKTSVMFEDYVDLDDDFALTEYEPWILYEIDSVSLENEIYVEQIPGAQVFSAVNIVIPDSWTVESFPADLSLETEFMKLNRKVTRKGDGSFSIKTDFEMPSIILPADKIEEFEAVMKLIRSQSAIRFSGNINK